MVARLNVSAFAKASARQSTPSASLRRKTGGKGIRTPDLLIANETLYQLSYTPKIGERLSRRSQLSSSIVRPSSESTEILKESLGFDDCFRYYWATPQLNDCDTRRS